MRCTRGHPPLTLLAAPPLRSTPHGVKLVAVLALFGKNLSVANTAIVDSALDQSGVVFDTKWKDGGHPEAL
jgi:hypothetical protein